MLFGVIKTEIFMSNQLYSRCTVLPFSNELFLDNKINESKIIPSLFFNSCLLVPQGAMNEPDLCFTWRSHVKTFDGRYFYFPGRCTYKLIHDCQDDLFSVHVFTDPLCNDLKNCRRAVNLYLGGLDIKVILLRVN